jgi:hypothetical protein
MIALAAGCNGKDPTATPTESPSPTPVPNPTRVVVLSDATATPRPTPTLYFDITPAIGQWLIDFRFEFTEGEIIEETTISFAASVEVDGTGQFAGRGEASVSVRHPGCNVRVLEGSNFIVKVNGRVVTQQEENSDVVNLFLEFGIDPESRPEVQVYERQCGDEIITYRSQLLWQALQLAELEPFRLPVEYPLHETFTADIESATQEQLNYHVEATVYLGR